MVKPFGSAAKDFADKHKHRIIIIPGIIKKIAEYLLFIKKIFMLIE